YETGVPMRMVKEVMHLNKFTHRHPVYADHDKYAISELRRLRAGNIHMAKKSILPGIAKVKEYKIYYTARSTNLKEEVGKYMWDKDRATGEFVNMPIDSFNHAMDAV